MNEQSLKKFTVDEIIVALSQMQQLKAPRLLAFIKIIEQWFFFFFFFFLLFWAIIGREVYRTVNNAKHYLIILLKFMWRDFSRHLMYGYWFSWKTTPRKLWVMGGNV